jgi:hypothetical protein
MIPLFAFAIFFALVVASAASGSARAATRRADGPAPKDGKAPRPIDPARLATAVKEVVASETDPARVEAAAQKLEDAGHPAAAAVARERAAELRGGSTTSTTSKSAEMIFPIPFAGIGAKAWNRYVRLMATATSETVSAGNQFGIFQIGYPRLADLGYVENVRKVHKKGRSVWVGDFKAPLTLAGFLKDVALQYQAFVQTTKTDRSAILARHAGSIGQPIAGKKATLSGLLAVAYHAGLAGLARWLSGGEEERKRSPRTTAAYQRAVGLF